MNIAGVWAWLCWYVCHSISANDVSAPEVTLCECQNNLWPSRDTVRPICDFKREIPNHTSVGLLTLVGVLRYSTLVSLYSNFELNNIFSSVDLPRLVTILSLGRRCRKSNRFHLNIQTCLTVRGQSPWGRMEYMAAYFRLWLAPCSLQFCYAH